MSFLEIALRNAARGFSVHPLYPQGKRPILAGWQHQATTDRHTIEEWAQSYTDANAGVIANEQVCVFESDNYMKLVELLGREVPGTFTVQARANRPHFYFRPTAKTKALGNRDLFGIFELKENNRFVVAEGSTHPTGAIYAIVNDAPIIDFPDWLADALSKILSEQKAQGKDAAPVEGGRNIYLTQVAGKLRYAGLGKDPLEVALLQHNEDVCNPPLPEDEVKQIAASVARYAVPEPMPEVTIGEEKRVTDWRELFHTREETENAPPISFLIDGFLQCEGVTGLAAPVRERKSLIALNVAHALVTGEKLFDHFSVVKKPERVLYLCPEMSLGPFSDRLKKIGLLNYVGERLFYRTLSKDGRVTLIDEALKSALPGSVVILDTAVRFISGDEDSSSDMRLFADELFALLRAGAEAVLVLYHSPKSQRGAEGMTLENALRGSGDLGAALACCWGTRLQDVSKPYESASFMENLKQRDFESKPFEVTSGPDCRMHIVGDPSMRDVKLQPRVGNKRNPDGMDDAAEAFIKANIDRYKTVREMEKQLKEIGIKRGTTWIGKVRNRITGTGVTRDAA